MNVHNAGPRLGQRLVFAGIAQEWFPCIIAVELREINVTFSVRGSTLNIRIWRLKSIPSPNMLKE